LNNEIFEKPCKGEISNIEYDTILNISPLQGFFSKLS